MTQIKGVALYQNRKPNSGILISVLDSQNAVLAQAVTDEKGNYSVQVPVQLLYSLAFSAPLYLTSQVAVQPDTPAPKVVILRGGDLDNDGCIGTSDLGIITASFQATSAAADVNGDGIVDARDLAILAGNFQGNCDLRATPTAEPTVTSTPLTTIEATPVTPTEAAPPSQTSTGTMTPTAAIVETLRSRLIATLTARATK